MKIIISPAKTMNVDTDLFVDLNVPRFIDRTAVLMQKIQSLTLSQAKTLWKCNDKLAKLNFDRFQHMDLMRELTPAIMAYQGLQFQQMAPGVFTDDELTYISNHLRILSGFYGIVNPFDGVVTYRLEMQAKLAIGKDQDLYDFWGNLLYTSIVSEDRTIINLASKEYAQCIARYIAKDDRFITILFGKLVNGKLKQETTLAKMARGKMVRFMAENNISDLHQIKEFHELGFTFAKELSNDATFVFVS